MQLQKKPFARTRSLTPKPGGGCRTLTTGCSRFDTVAGGLGVESRKDREIPERVQKLVNVAAIAAGLVWFWSSSTRSLAGASDSSSPAIARLEWQSRPRSCRRG
jgi:hypothetical protein